MTPLVSIVFPVYNCSKFIRQSLNSILNQTYTNLEILICDDGSTDNTRDILESYVDPRITFLHNDTNQGNIYTRNKLFEAAKGEYLTIQDADDWSDPERIQLQLEKLRINSHIGGCGTNYYIVRPNSNKILSHKMYDDIPLIVEKEWKMVPASLMIRREVYEAIGNLDPYFQRLFGEDRYWINKILERYPLLQIAKPLYYYRVNPNSLTNIIDNPRKMIVIELIKELLRQRGTTNSDWLEKKDFIKLKEFEDNLLGDKEFISEQLRLYAAVAIDQRRYSEASNLLLKSFQNHLLTTKQISTLIYLIKSFLKVV